MTTKRSLIRIAALAIAVSAALPAMADTLVAAGRHHYVWFGDHDIYYAPETKTYFWLDNGRWQSGYNLPRQYEPYVSSRGVDIELDTDRPYERNDYVIEHYRSAPVVAQERVTRESAPVTRETTTTERNGDNITTTTTTTTTKHRYVYYGDRDIYFSPETNMYFWEQDGRWVSGTTLPPERQAYVRAGGVNIELDTERPYERNSMVIARYGHRHHDRDEEHHDDD